VHRLTSAALPLFFVASLTLMFLTAFAQSRPSDWHPVVDVARWIEENNIRESVFRYRIERQKFDGVVFLTIDGKDPSDEFMTRFAMITPPVRKASGSYSDSQGMSSLRDRSTKRRAILLEVGTIKWLSEDHVELNGGFYCGALCADAGIYEVVKKNGRWTVAGYKVEMVS